MQQQKEIVSAGDQLVESFRARSRDNRLLLDGFTFRAADLIFDGDLRLDLGGVTVEVFQAGPAHTDGDVALLVREDGVLFTGDVVQQDYAPILLGAHSTAASWLARIDQLEKLPAHIIVPSHSAVTNRRAFSDMREMVTFLRRHWSKIRHAGGGPAAQETLIADFARRFPACKNAPLVGLSIPRLSAAD